MPSPRLFLAALAAVLSLPVAAQASTVELRADGTLSVRAAAGVADRVDCGPGSVDTLQRDTVDAFRNCDNFGIGVCKLAVSGNAVKLSWTHPKAWRKLRRLVLYVMDDQGAAGQGQVGEVHINVRHPRFETVGGVELARGSRLARHGKTVSARFKLRIHPSWSDANLAYEVEAVDIRGHREVQG